MQMPIERILRSMLTKYPKIYENVYWGRGSVRYTTDITPNDDNNYSCDEIIQNRNEFIETHNIKRVFKIPDIRPSKYYWSFLTSSGHCSFMDHKEVYLTENNTIIILVSPYSPSSNILKFGFTLIKPMYALHASSYYIEISKNFNKKYLQTIELEKYWGKPIHELTTNKKPFTYWFRMMRYEQCFAIRGKFGCERNEANVLERENDIILDYMQSLLQGMCRRSDSINADNLYEFHKCLDSIDTNCWVNANTEN